MTGLLGDVMAAATTVKVNDATEPMLRRLGVLVERRRYTAVRDRVLEEGVQAFTRAQADIGLGLVLLVSTGTITSGSFDLGTLALFTAYLGWLSFLPRMVGRVLAARTGRRTRSTGCAHWSPIRRPRTRCEVSGCRSTRTISGCVPTSCAPSGSRSSGWMWRDSPCPTATDSFSTTCRSRSNTASSW